MTPRQIELLDLPTRPTKQTDTRAKGFGAISVELDAIEPNALRHLVRGYIEDHLPRAELDVLLQAEASERTMLEMFVERAVDDSGAAV